MSVAKVYLAIVKIYCTCRPWGVQAFSSLDLKDRTSLDPRCQSLDLGNRSDLRLPRYDDVLLHLRFSLKKG